MGDAIAYSASFLRFWQLYPRKKQKGDAFKAYRAVKGPRPTWEVVRTSIRASMASEQWQDPTKIPYPATWIRARGWEDEHQAPAPKLGERRPDSLEDARVAAFNAAQTDKPFALHLKLARAHTLKEIREVGG